MPCGKKSGYKNKVKSMKGGAKSGVGRLAKVKTYKKKK